MQVYPCIQPVSSPEPGTTRETLIRDRTATAIVASGSPAAVARWGRGRSAALACRLETTAAKVGNVHPAAAFADLSHDELVAAGEAIAAPLDHAASRPLGRTILDAVTASRRVTRSNANLGIVLTIAPLAAVPDGVPLSPAAAAAVLAATGPDDARDVYAAIALANPGGMGRRDNWDIAGPAPENLLDAMGAAADRDQIARLWSRGYDPLFAGPVADIAAGIESGLSLGAAIERAHLMQLAREPDTLIARKHGAAAAVDASARAAAVLAAGADWPAGAADLDRFLRARRMNPGTTADLVAAALYILLVTGRLGSLAGDTPTIDSTLRHD
jgi:triphosphoribosyl-dephospho-CoA synthase